MPTFDSTQAPETSAETEWVPVPTDKYRLRIIKAWIGKSKRFFDEKTGEPNEELTLVFELINKLTHPQAPDKQYRDRLYWSMAPVRSVNKTTGVPSKFKALTDELIAAGMIPPQFEVVDREEKAETGHLVGLELDVFVDCYAKSDGKLTNRVLRAMPPNAQPAPSNGTPAQPDITDNQYFEYLRSVANGVDGMPDDELLRAARELAPATNNPWWIKKEFVGRNAEQLRNDIRTMWAMVERHRKEAETGELAF